MVYEQLMDNVKNNFRFINPPGFDIHDIYVDGMYYPNILRVDKQTYAEYWPLCLWKAHLWITYAVTINAEPVCPLLSNCTEIPLVALARFSDVIVKFEHMWDLPVNGMLLRFYRYAGAI